MKMQEKRLKAVVFATIACTMFANTNIKAQTDAPKEEFKPTAKIFADVFGDYYYKMASDTDHSWGTAQFAKKGVDDQGFIFRRAYFGGAFQFTKNVSGKVMYEGEDGNLLTTGKKAAGNLKYAYLKIANIWANGGTFVIGAQHTPTWSPFTEKIWGYRSIEKTIFDARKMGGSNDVGATVTGHFDKAGTLTYALMVGNGKGQKPESDKYKKIYGSINGKMMDKKLLWEIYVDYEDHSAEQSKMTVKGFLGFQTDKITIGLEGGNQKQTQMGAVDTATGKQQDVVPMGFTGFVRGVLVKDKLNFFVRSDYFDNNSNSNDTYTENFFVAGVDFTPVKNTHLMPNIWINTYTAKGSMPDRDPDIVPRLTFWWKFK
ncbi:MAG: hypothetical protein ACE5DN_03735 [Flavobacteriales bacterium]